MGSHAQRNNLGHFLLNLLDNGEVSGLEWINRNDKVFKIPWMDKRNPVWANTEDVIPKKWEIYNNRYLEGNPENCIDWKQKFRGALNKSPYVEAIPKMHQKKHPTMPYLAYRFTDAINIHEPNAILKRNRSKNSSRNLHSGAGIECDTQSSPRGNIGTSPKTEFQILNECNREIPQVVLDELNNVSDSDDVFDESYLNYRTCPKLAIGQSRSCDNTPPSLGENMDTDTDFNLANFDLDSSFGIQQNPMETFPPIPSPCPIFHGNLVNTTAGPPINIKFQAYYLKRHNVLEGTIGENGVCLSSGLKSRTLINQLRMGNIDYELWKKIRGPGYFNQVELPSVSQCTQISNKSDFANCQELHDILESMERGVLLFYNVGKLFVYRLCRTHVYATVAKEGHLIIDRKNQTEHQLFDLAVFKRQLELFHWQPENNVCPSPTVTLTFGTKQGMEPIVHLDLTVLEAENMLRRDRQDILISDFDSGDLFLEGFNSLKLNSKQ